MQLAGVFRGHEENVPAEPWSEGLIGVAALGSRSTYAATVWRGLRGERHFDLDARHNQHSQAS